jgi:hypothetical protein
VLGFEVPDFPNIQPLKLFSHSVHTLQMETSRTVQGRPPGIEWFPSGRWNPLKNDLRVSPSPSPSHDMLQDSTGWFLRRSPGGRK